jgi:hypothetical protein
MPRLVGLAYASRLYRELEALHQFTQFSHNGDEIAFGMVGNATTAEGMFWEAINAIGVLRAPALISIWDDGYGISVPNQMVPRTSLMLKGFRDTKDADGLTLRSQRGLSRIRTYLQAADVVRREHIPAIIHVIELTQPLGHSTSGSHERYKTKERLMWERDYDCLVKFRQWIRDNGCATDQELDQIDAEEHQSVEEERHAAWEAYLAPIREERKQASDLIHEIAATSTHATVLGKINKDLLNLPNPLRRDIQAATFQVLMAIRDENLPKKTLLVNWTNKQAATNEELYSSHLYSTSDMAALNIPVIEAVYSPDSPLIALSVSPAHAMAAIHVIASARCRPPGRCRPGFRVAGEIRPPLIIWETTIIGGRSAWRSAACGRSPKSNIWTTFCTRCRSCPTTWQRSIGARKAGRKRLLSCARAATAWRASGTPDR